MGVYRKLYMQPFKSCRSLKLRKQCKNQPRMIDTYLPITCCNEDTIVFYKEKKYIIPRKEDRKVRKKHPTHQSNYPEDMNRSSKGRVGLAASRIVHIKITETGEIERLLNPEKRSKDFRDSAEDTCDKPWFHDISEIFEVFLTSRKDLAFVYPPGSGKSTVAETFQKFADCNTCDLPSSFESYFDNCKLKNATVFQDNYRKCNVVLVDFKKVDLGDVTRDSEESIRRKYVSEMCTIASAAWSQPEAFESHYNDTEAPALRIYPSRYKNSLSDLYLRLGGCEVNEKPQKGFIIYDSIDSMYHQIAKISIVKLRRELLTDFTNAILVQIVKQDNVKRIFFGVSPYFISEYIERCGACIFSISPYPLDSAIDPEFIEKYQDLVAKTFSYSEDIIQATCDKINERCETDTSLRKIDVEKMKTKCTKVAQYEVNGVQMINPYLAVSYLWSYTKQLPYKLNISPRSLWYDCIFTKYDIQPLLDILNKPTIFEEFDMCEPITSIIDGRVISNRKNFLPLFVNGGYYSVISTSPVSVIDGKEVNRYELKVVNETMKIILDYSLKALWKQAFLISYPESADVFDVLVHGNYEEVCKKLSQVVDKMPLNVVPDEKMYQTMIGAVLSSCIWKKWNLLLDHPVSSLKPDFVISKKTADIEHTLVGELKVLVPSKKYNSYIKFGDDLGKASTDEERKEFLEFVKNESWSSDDSRIFLIADLLKKIKAALKKIDDYGAAACSRFETSTARLFIMVFHFNHVLLAHRIYVPANAEANFEAEKKTWKFYWSEHFPLTLADIEKIWEDASSNVGGRGEIPQENANDNDGQETESGADDKTSQENANDNDSQDTESAADTEEHIETKDEDSETNKEQRSSSRKRKSRNDPPSSSSTSRRSKRNR